MRSFDDPLHLAAVPHPDRGGVRCLAIVAVALPVTGPHLVSLYNASVASCAARGDCVAASTALLRNDATLRTWLGVLTVVLPGVIGVFWGAPLVARELEAGTFRLA